MTKTAREILLEMSEFDIRKHPEHLDQALKEIESIIEATYDNLPSLDKLTVGNEMSDGYDQGVEAFRQAMIKALYGKEYKS